MCARFTSNRSEVMLRGIGGVLAQIQRVRLMGEPRISGQESGEREPFRIGERVMLNDGGRENGSGNLHDILQSKWLGRCVDHPDTKPRTREVSGRKRSGGTEVTVGHDRWDRRLRAAGADPRALAELLSADLPYDGLQHAGDAVLAARVEDTDGSWQDLGGVDRGVTPRGWDGDDILAGNLERDAATSASKLTPLGVDLEDLADTLAEHAGSEGFVDLQDGQVWTEIAIEASRDGACSRSSSTTRLGGCSSLVKARRRPTAPCNGTSPRSTTTTRSGD